MKKSAKKHIVRDNKVALYFHLAKKRVYFYLPKNTQITKDDKGYFVRVDAMKKGILDILKQ